MRSRCPTCWHVAGFTQLYPHPPDNWALFTIQVFGLKFDVVDVKMAFNAGFSYVEPFAGNLLSSAQSSLGSIMRGARKLGGRVIGYISTFVDRLSDISERIQGYLTTGDTFIGVVSQFGDVSDVLSLVTTYGLRTIQEYSTKLLGR